MIKFFYYIYHVILISIFLSYARTKAEPNDNIFLRYYNNTLLNYIDGKLDNIQFLISKMDKNKPTVLYIHGFTEDVKFESVSTVICAYLKRNDHNILAVDYRNISKLSYIKAVKKIKYVAYALSLALNKMVEDGFNPDNFHIVGHSLGSQISRHIGERTKFKLSRITGLDPAGPLFNFIESHLSSNDARFVDIIHTDYGFYGIARTTGTVDFFPNGGRRLQPGCEEGGALLSDKDFCSHWMSWKYYAISLIKNNSLMAFECPTYNEFLSGKCKGNVEIPMGFETPTNAKGTFYLNTNIDILSALNELDQCMNQIKYQNY